MTQVLRIADIDNLVQIRPTNIEILHKYIPLPKSCSNIFLQKIVDEIVMFSGKFGLGTDQINNIRLTGLLDIKAERVIDLDGGQNQTFNSTSSHSKNEGSQYQRQFGEMIDSFACRTVSNDLNNNTNDLSSNDLSFDIELSDNEIDINQHGRETQISDSSMQKNTAMGELSTSNENQLITGTVPSMDQILDLNSQSFLMSQVPLNTGWKCRKTKVWQNQSCTSQTNESMTNLTSNRNQLTPERQNDIPLRQELNQYHSTIDGSDDELLAAFYSNRHKDYGTQ